MVWADGIAATIVDGIVVMAAVEHETETQLVSPGNAT